MECMCLTLVFCRGTCVISHTFTPTPEQTTQLQTDVRPRTQTPAPVPTVLSAGMCGINEECLIFQFGCRVDTLPYLPVRPNEACQLSAASVRD